MTDTFAKNMAIFAPVKVRIDEAASHLQLVNSPAMGSSLSSGTLENNVDAYLNALLQSSTDNPLTVLNYRPCKLYDGSAKRVAKPDLSKQWFVYYSYRNPATKKMERKPVFKEINSYTTITERKKCAAFWIRVYNTLLRAGFSPFEAYVNPTTGEIDPNIISCMDMYLVEKKKVLAPKSYAPYSQHVNYFRAWVTRQQMNYMEIKDFKRSHIKLFLSDYQSRTKCSNRNINNIKDNIITLFNYFVKNFEDTIGKNPASGLEDLPYTTEGNRAYTDKQITLLKEIMQRENPNMLFFCEMIYETCARPHEEARLFQVRDLQFDQNRIHVRPELSKEGRSEYIPMSSRFMNRLQDYVKGYKETDYLFSIDRNPGKKSTNPFRPGPSPVSEDTLQTWYRKIKNQLGMHGEWSIYSWAHTYCCRAYLDTKDIFYIKEKKRHTNLAVTSNYLRGMGLFVDLQKVAENVREF